MKQKLLLLLPVCAILVGCGPKDGTSDTSTADAAANAVQSAGDKAAEWTRQAGEWMTASWNSVKDTTYENKAVLEAKMDEVSAKIEEQIDKTKVAAANLSGEAKKKAELALTELNKAKDAVDERAKEVAAATAEQWPALKKEIGEAWTETGETITKVWDSATGSSSGESTPAE